MAKPDRLVRLEHRVAELEASAERAEERALTIQAIAAAVGSSLNLEEVLHVILDKVTDLLNAERSSLFLLNEERDRLVSVIAQGAGETGVTPIARIFLAEMRVKPRLERRHIEVEGAFLRPLGLAILAPLEPLQ